MVNQDLCITRSTNNGKIFSNVQQHYFNKGFRSVWINPQCCRDLKENWGAEVKYDADQTTSDIWFAAYLEFESESDKLFFLMKWA